jgi:hypothetical protein
MYTISHGPGRVRPLTAAALTLGLLLAALAFLAGAVPGAPRPAARADDTTASLNDLRTGWDPNEPGLSPSVVSGPAFGKVFSTSLDGQVYGQPLVVGDTLIAATENDYVYGLNATTGAVLWKTKLGTPYHITTCSDLTPNIGDTATPVYDPSTGTVYVLALVKETSYQFHLFGINATTGAVTFKKRIAGSPTNDSHISFDAVQEGQRAGLLLLNGWVYAAFASHCDHKPYVGYVAGWNLASHATTLWSDESGTSDDQAGIWQSGGGLMTDQVNGRFFFTSGNGISPPKAPGDNPPGQLAESVVQLSPQSSGSLKAEDFFSPADAPTLDAGDVDYGAGGPVELPVGTQAYPNVIVQAGKDGHIFLLNANSLGGREQAPGGGNDNLYRTHPVGGQWGHPAVFEASTSPLPASTSGVNDDIVYLGKDDYLREWQLNTNSSDTPNITDVANSTFTFGYTSGSPVITSTGTDPSSAVIWVVYTSGKTGSGGRLDAFDLVPQPRSGGGTELKEIWSGSIGTASKFTIPATSNGMVYVGNRNGDVIGFGNTSQAALRGAGQAAFGATPVGGAASKTVTVTARRPVTVTKVSSSAQAAADPFSVGRLTVTRRGGKHPARVTLPVTLHPGDALHAPVRFAPTAPGGVPGDLTFATRAAGPAASVALYGEATKTGLTATSSSLSFLLILNDGTVTQPIPVGVQQPQVTTIANDGTSPVTITSVNKPGGPFTVTGIPKPGTVIRPGSSFVVQVTYAPSRAGPVAGSLTIRASRGSAARISLSGSGAAPVSKFSASPASVNFGTVAVGHTATVWVKITNAGNQPSLIAGTIPPAAPFRAVYRVATGLPVNGSYDLTVPIAFTPPHPGAFHSVYKLSWTDRFGEHTIGVPVSGTGTG